MELTEAVTSRRSVRAYKKDTTVEQSTIEEIIRFAQEAPSWKNSQTGRYYVAISPEKVAAVKEKSLPEFNQKSCADAPVLIVTTFVKNRAGFDREGNPDNELGNEWGAYDLGLQNELLTLKATELGLDTLIMGIRNGDALRTEFDIPETEEVVAVIALGYRDNDPEKPKRKDVEAILKFF